MNAKDRKTFDESTDVIIDGMPLVKALVALQEAADELVARGCLGEIYFHLGTEWGDYDDGNSTKCYLSGTRDETDEEYEKRQIVAAKRAKTLSLARKIKKDKDYEQYLALKRKFENKE